MSRSVDDALRATVNALRASGSDTAASDARHLLAHAMKLGRDRLILVGPDPVPPDAEARLKDALTRRLAHEPVSRIIGQRQFWGRSFAISPDVLDPRADTETLIAAALQGPAPTRFLDLGTGSGAIALTLLAEWPQAQAVATDISAAALAVASRNAEALEVAGRIDLVLSDWFDGMSGRFDLIVSNPPYISETEMRELSPDVSRFDPAIALTPGGDGLDAYRCIAARAAGFLAPEGRVIVEMGWRQGPDVMSIFRANGWRVARLIPDLEGRDRVLIAQNPAEQAETTRK